MQEQPPSMKIQPQPMPFGVNVGTVKWSDGKNYVVLQIDTLYGNQVIFMEPDVADAVADNMNNSVRTARSGLIIMPPGSMPNGKVT